MLYTKGNHSGLNKGKSLWPKQREITLAPTKLSHSDNQSLGPIFLHKMYTGVTHPVTLFIHKKYTGVTHPVTGNKVVNMSPGKGLKKNPLYMHATIITVAKYLKRLFFCMETRQKVPFKLPLISLSNNHEAKLLKY